jgi:hypothetical protein
LWHIKNACGPISLTLSGMLTLVRWVQEWNAPSQMTVTLRPRVTLVRRVELNV